MPRAPALARRVADELILEREVEQRRQPALAHERVELERVGDEDLAEDEEVLTPARLAAARIARQPLPEERRVDVTRGVDPDAVDLVPLDPDRVDVREPVS